MIKLINVERLVWIIRTYTISFYKDVIRKIIRVHKYTDYPAGCVDRTKYHLTVLGKTITLFEITTHYPVSWWTY